MMSEHILRKLNFGRTSFFLATAWMIVAPIAFGQKSSMPVAAVAQAQDVPAGSAIAFDVVSVKQNKMVDAPFNLNDPSDGDGPTFTGMTLRWIIDYAFDIQSDDLISGMPDWTKTEHYDIQAKVADSDVEAYHKLSKAQRRMMLQVLLADRFKMQIHRESRDVSMYALVVGKKGSTMKEVKPGELRTSGIKNLDGTIVQGQILVSRLPGQIIAQEIPMAIFAGSLSGLAGRQVIDKTGLKGDYDFTLEWDPNEGANGASGGESAAIPTEASSPSIFAAVEEQLGLKLEPQKVLMPVIVIDHMERPSGN